MKAGHRLVLLNPQEMVESVLRTSRMDKIMPIAYDLDEAVRILQGVHGQSAVASPRPATSVEQPGPERSELVSAAPSAIEGQSKRTIKNELSELKGLNASLAQFLNDHQVPARAAYAVSLAIDELVVNVMRYAYVDDDTHYIDIELAIEGDQVILRIVDEGRPFDPRRGPSLDLHAEDREVGGLGLILVLDMVDVLKYRRVEERNWVEVRIRLITEEQDGDLQEARGASPEGGGQ